MKLFLICILIILIAPARAGNVTINSIDDATALAIATSQHHFDFSTYRLQGSVGVGHYSNRDAFSFASAKKLCNSCVLINGSISGIEGKFGVGLGVSWRF